MLTYQAPLKDMAFVLDELLAAPSLLQGMPPFAEVDRDLMMQVIEEAGRFATGVLAPLSAPAHAQGCRFDNGRVTTPDGFVQAWQQFCDAGWPALACHAEYGGQALPHLLNCLLYEMLSAANHAWTMFPGLLHGAYACLHQHADETLKARYLPKLASGEWLATMALTEPQAGSDLGLLRTRAVMQPDGSARITGSKIFISGGEQDWSANIVHLVLARLPDAPEGSKGISLFLVPKFLPAQEGGQGEPGELGARNAVVCTGIEHKMGIHGSATASLQFDGATGWLVGQPHRGLAAMFVMMNAARLHVGLQGLGQADKAYQNALAYAQQREQMRAVHRPASRTGLAADPIVLHPPVQRLLMTQRVYVEGGRMLGYWAALLLDTAEHHPEAPQRTRAHALLALITPVIKSLMSEQGFMGASAALQVFGGHGYVAETGIEQVLRDTRIAMIYEGTNEIQAIDLLLRKVLADEATVLHRWLGQIEETVKAAPTIMAAHADVLFRLLDEVREITQAIMQAQAQNPALPHLIAGDYLRLLAQLALGWFWLRAALCAHARLHQTQQNQTQQNGMNTQVAADPAFYASKLHAARYYFDFVFPETRSGLQIIHNALAASRAGQADFCAVLAPDAAPRPT